MRKLLWLGAATIVFAGCSGSPTAPSQTKKAPSQAVRDDDPECPFGWASAYDEEGKLYCVPPDGPNP